MAEVVWGGRCPPWRWSAGWNPVPDPGPLKSQELPLPLLVPGFIMEDPLEPGVTWPSSRNLKMGVRMSFNLVFLYVLDIHYLVKVPWTL